MHKKTSITEMTRILCLAKCLQDKIYFLFSNHHSLIHSKNGATVYTGVANLSGLSCQAGERTHALIGLLKNLFTGESTGEDFYVCLQ